MMSTTDGELDLDVAPEREDGEIADSDVEGGTYIPLERPNTFNPPSLVNMQIQDEPSDEGSQEGSSSGSDSEGELRRRPKRTKIRVRRPQAQSQDKRNKYNVWCTTVQEDLLTEDMVACDVTNNRRYGVESYDYTIKYRLDENEGKKTFTQNDNCNRFSNKRKHEDRGNVKLRLGKREDNHRKDNKKKTRVLADLNVTIDDDVEDIAKDIANKLYEEKADLLLRIVQLLGASKAMELYKETQTVEADGGMLVMNGTRRRTPGGTYFFLLKRDDEISQERISKIFMEDRKETQRKTKRIRVKSRQKVVEQLKQSLTDSELPSLLSRSEATIIRTEHGSNPPPSPATDAKDYSSDTDAHSHTDALPPTPPQNDTLDSRNVQKYDDDDYLEVMCNDDMDLF